jgi:hypothetical protein
MCQLAAGVRTFGYKGKDLLLVPRQANALAIGYHFCQVIIVERNIGDIIRHLDPPGIFIHGLIKEF